MLKSELYEGREQTYVKHFFLENYLERVAYNIFSFEDEIVYVDGFSGPWMSKGQRYEDTSFNISINLLRKVKAGIKNRTGRNIKLRCLFIEKNTTAFNKLKGVVNNIDDINIKIINGEFENHIDDICSFIGKRFSLIFIDPTGWKGFSMESITPLLQLRGEVIINFMSKFITRFLEDPREGIAQSYNSLFGDGWFEEWKELENNGMGREIAALEVYKSRVKEKCGQNAYITWTPVLEPLAEKTIFYLIYITTHWKGMQEFKSIEKKAVDVQEKVRHNAKYKAKQNESQLSFFQAEEMLEDAPNSLDAKRESYLSIGFRRLKEMVKGKPQQYENVLGRTLETPLVWKSDVDGWLRKLKKEEMIEIRGMGKKERTPKRGYTIIPKRKNILK